MIQHHKKLSLELDRLLPAGGLQPKEALPRLRRAVGSAAE
jgi:hypothetical protein